jgi:hypothetical protein
MASIKKRYWDYYIAQAYAKKNDVRSALHWRECVKGEVKNVPVAPKLPRYPEDTYVKEWQGWIIFLNKKVKPLNPQNKLEFELAKRYVRWVGIKSTEQFRLWADGKIKVRAEFSNRLPKDPPRSYKEEWQGWNDFLGLKEKTYKIYEEAKDFVQGLSLNSIEEWKEYKRGLRTELPEFPKDLPRIPDEYYQRKKTWSSWSDFLGTGRLSSGKALSFYRAKKFVQSLRLKSKRDYLAYVQGKSERKLSPPLTNLPRVPNKVYKKEWQGWGDFLGTGRKQQGKQKYHSFEKARAFVRRLKINDEKEWLLYAKGKLPGRDIKPKDIPFRPNTYYKEEWKGYNDFLGNGKEKGKSHPKYVSYKEARDFARNLGLKNTTQWRNYTYGRMKKSNLPPMPKNMVGDVKRYYTKKGTWKSWKDFLGS